MQLFYFFAVLVKGGNLIEEKLNERKKKEEKFCRIYSKIRDSRFAAKQVDLEDEDEVLGKKSVQRRLEKMEENLISGLQNDARAGLRRLALYDAGEVATALEFAVRNETGIKNCDSFFGVSEIKFPKGGGVEVKFFDRFKPLEKLLEISKEKQTDSSGFIEALLAKGEADGEV